MQVLTLFGSESDKMKFDPNYLTLRVEGNSIIALRRIKMRNFLAKIHVGIDTF